MTTTKARLNYRSINLKLRELMEILDDYCGGSSDNIIVGNCAQGILDLVQVENRIAEIELYETGRISNLTLKDIQSITKKVSEN